MEYFRRLIEVSVLLIVILIISPLLQVMGEEKSYTDATESNTESVKNGGTTDYTISIRTTGDNMTLYTDSKLIGKTPLTLTLKEGESLQIYGTNKKGDIVFKTTLEGGKMPQGLLIQYSEPGLGKKTGIVMRGLSIGVISSLLLFVCYVLPHGFN